MSDEPEIGPKDVDIEEQIRLLRGERNPTRVSDPQYQGLAEEKGYDQSYSRIAKVGYSHEAMIDLIIASPRITQNELASHFGYTVPWISRVIGSDAFQAALAKRREDVTDPFLIATVEERLKGIVIQSIDVIARKLAQSDNADLALKALDIGAKAAGFGARNISSGPIQNNFVVQLPGKAENAQVWAREHSPVQIEGKAA